MDELKKILSENRDKLDVYEPSADLWEKISREIPTEKKWTSSSFLRIAAAVLIFSMVSVTVFLSVFNEKRSQVSQWESDLIEVNIHYTTLIHQRLDQLEKIEDIDIQEKQEIYAFIAELDNELEELKMSFDEDIDNEKVVQALILHYRKRLEILEAILNRLSNKQIKEKNDEIIL